MTKIPAGFETVTPYLTITDVAHVIDFLQTTFNAEVKDKIANDDGTIMHAELKIGSSMVMMGEPEEKDSLMPGSLYVYVDNVDETYKKALEAGAKSIREPEDQFYGDRNAGVKDSSGNIWFIATHL